MKLFKRENYVPLLESCIIGAVAGFSAVVLSAGVSWLGALRVHFSNLYSSHYVLPLFGFTGGLIAGLLVERVAPEASGSGIPQVRARLDRIVMALDLRIAIAKLLGGTLVLGSGFFLGREGPTVQLGAALAAPLARLLPTTAEHKRQLIAAGAGAGLTAAFNAPLAGITFVTEELLKEIKPSTLVITVIACSVSCFVLNAYAPPHLHAAAAALAPAVKFAPKDVPFYLLLGVMAGCFGAVFNQAILTSLKFNRYILKVPVALRVALAGLITGAIISTLPESFHNFAGMRALITAGESNWITVMVAFLEFYLLTLIAYGSGAPGGLFAPSLAIGSSLGYLLGYLELLLTGSGSTAAFALVGMGCFFSAVARTPLTAIVITFELTGNFAILTPLMFTSVMSSAIAEMLFKDGLYEHLMRWNGINLRGPSSDNSLSKLKALDVMHTSFLAFSSKSLVSEILSTFSESAQHGFLVIEREKLVGVVTQTDLVKLEPLSHMTVKEIMTPYPVAINIHDSLEEILFLFSQYKYTWLPVTDHDKPKGIILQSDILKAMFAEEFRVKTEQLDSEALHEKSASHSAADQGIGELQLQKKTSGRSTED